MYLDLGQLYNELALHDKEIAIYETLLARDPSVAVAHSYLATAIVAKYAAHFSLSIFVTLCLGTRSRSATDPWARSPQKTTSSSTKRWRCSTVQSVHHCAYETLLPHPHLPPPPPPAELDPTCGMCHGQRADLLKDAHR
jgi:hypothetical protein